MRNKLALLQAKIIGRKAQFRRFLANKVFNMLLIERNSQDPQAAIRQMTEALENDSLILFPEGTRKRMMICLSNPLKVACIT